MTPTQPQPSHGTRTTFAARLRVAWTVASYVVVQSLVLGAASLPVALGAERVGTYLPTSTWARVVACAIGLLPTYFACATVLVVASAAAARLLGWRVEPGMRMPVRELGWPLMDWARGAMLTHVVRVLVAIPMRVGPLWSWYMRLNGAHIGRRVWVNSINIADHHLLVFGDDVVIGSDVHLSGHTVEGGVVRTGTVRVGSRVTIGAGSMVNIDVEIGDDARVGALSYVPKGSTLTGGDTWVGAPVRALGGAGPRAACPELSPPAPM